MAIRIGINGFGRIGRNVFRNIYTRNLPIEVVAINDLADANTMAHLLKYDSIHGRFPGDIHVDNDTLVVGKEKLKVIAERDPSKLPWKELDVDIVLESTGIFRKRAQAAQHITAGASKVVISAPSGDADVMIVLGVNHEQYDPERHDVISNASCTTNCLAPICYVVQKHFGFKQGMMTTIHSYTADQKIHDAPHRDLRRARAAALSMIPTSTGAASAVGVVLPELKGKIDGLAIRVPTPNVSLVDLVVETEKSTTLDAIIDAMKAESQSRLKGILDVESSPLVSVDYMSNPYSSVFDVKASMQLNDHTFKLISWYDNEYGYSNRVADAIQYIAKPRS